ncbi:glycerophosphodiester phosphodiesterase [Micrococcaceae bacterium RIT802]|nr:glycerophosphodiester phosphodiesterase [Micrococcaceae bacterium RIT 802]
MASRSRRRWSLRNMSTLASVLVLWQGLALLLVVPVMRFLFHGALDAAGTPNLTDQSFALLTHHPTSLLWLLGMGVIATGVLCLQYTSVIALAHALHTGSAHPGPTAWRSALRATGTAMGWQLPLVGLYLLLLLPLSGLGELSPLTHQIGIAPFVTAEYLKKPLSIAIYLSATSALFYLNLRLLATLPALVVQQVTPLRAMAASWKATNGRRLRLPLLLASPAAAVLLAYQVPGRAMAAVAEFPGVLLQTDSRLVAVLGQGFSRALTFLILVAVTVAIIHILLVRLGHRGTTSTEPTAQPSTAAATGVRDGRRLAFRLGAAATALVMAVVGAPSVAAAPVQTADPLVIAHRGYVWGGVENTIGALDAAAAQHPDVVEVDVQQTKDGHFIASHDTNLLVLSGRNVNTYDLTLAQAEKTTVSARGFSDTIPSMVDYVRHAKKLGIKLLIEPKVHGHETPDYLERFIAELQSVGPLEDNIYHSLDADLVEALKARRPDLSVGYTIAMTAGGAPDVNCDFYVVEQASYSPRFMAEAKAAGKPVYVWTVNREDRIRSYLYDGVAGIVTDHPDVAREARDHVENSHIGALRLREALEQLAQVVPSPDPVPSRSS